MGFGGGRGEGSRTRTFGFGDDFLFILRMGVLCVHFDGGRGCGVVFEAWKVGGVFVDGMRKL